MKNKIDTILAAAVGIAAFFIMMAFPFVGIHPYGWDDTAIAAGLLPQGAMLPGLGLYVAHLLFAIFPYEAALTLTVVLAKALMAVTAFLLVRTLIGFMESVSVVGMRDERRRRLAIRFASVSAAFVFACSDPVGHAAQALTGSTFVLFLLVLALYFTSVFLRTARPSTGYVALATIGVLTAENPLGWLVLALAIFLTVRVSQENTETDWATFLNPARMQRAKWILTFTFLGAFVIAVLVEMLGFVLLDGLKANGVTAGNLTNVYVNAYVGLASGAMNIPGICLFIFFVAAPMALAMLMLRPSTDEDRFLSFKYALIFVFCGALAFLQLSPVDVFWFWHLTDGVSVSRTAVLFSALVSSVTLAWAFLVLCVEIFCRNYRYVQNVIYRQGSDDGSEETDASGDIPSVRLTVGRVALLIIPIACAALVVWGRRLPEDRLLQRLMYAFINETIEEAAGTSQIFTDGSYDSVLRLEAKRRGVPVHPVSLLSGSSNRDAYIRRQSAQGFEDRMSLETGAVEALKTWVVSKSEKISDLAVQLAFELFRLNRHLKPIVYGVLVRPAGGDPAAAAASVERCHRLSDEIVAVQENGTWRHAKDKFLKDRFLFAQFRLAVMSRLRAINLDAAKNTKDSIAEIAYSDRLNANNPSLLKILRRLDWVKRQSGEALTPREGLEVAMKRADFVMARRYALPLLQQDPEEPNANFAVGMSYYAEEQYAKAEEYLKRCLKKLPEEPAIHNNIALICLKTNRLKEAEEYAAKAVELAGELPEILDTVRQIEAAKGKRANPFLRVK